MIRIVNHSVNHQAVIDAVSDSGAGSIVTFDGRIRDHARGRRVTSLFYEAYERMAERQMTKIRLQAMERWPLCAVAIVHRIGHLEIGETSVFIAVSSAHRGEGFEACRYIIDTIKAEVPIWKKEFYEDGEIWVDG